MKIRKMARDVVSSSKAGTVKFLKQNTPWGLEQLAVEAQFTEPRELFVASLLYRN